MINTDIEKWFNEYGYLYDDDVREDFLYHVNLYLDLKRVKGLEERIREKLGRPYAERVRTGTKYAGKLALELYDLPSKKGRELLEILEDLGEHPDQYFREVSKTSATLDDIYDFLDIEKMDPKAKKALLTVLKR